MKTLKKMRFVSILLTILLVVMMAVPTMSIAAPPSPLKVELLTTSGFAVLSALSITNTGTTTINGDAGGDVGLSPGASSSFTGQATLTKTGALHAADAAALLAQTDLVTVYNDAAGRVGVPSPVELGGLTLTPGVYSSAVGFQITGTLTLDAQGDPEGVFIFQSGTTLITADNSNVSLINSARYCRTFWQVGSSATLGINSHFVGHIFALTSITANTGATVQGQLLARNGSVTLDSNTITNGICLAPPVLRVIKHVINDDGRTAVASNFNLHVKVAGGIDVAGSPAAGAEAPGTAYTLAAGNYVVSEDAFAGYTMSYSGDSDASGNITLAFGDNKTVTITNNDIAAPSSPTPAPTYSPLIKIVKIPTPTVLTTGHGLVTYTYKVTNPGMVALSNVSVTDDKVSIVNYTSGDINKDNLLQPSETWIYTSKANLTATTTNTATAKGSANGLTATDITFATVIVTVETTVTGGKLPNTSTPLYELILFGSALMLIGAAFWRNIKRYE